MLTVHSCEEWLIHQTAVITFTEISRGWKNGLTGISWHPTRASAATSYTRNNNPINSYMLGSTQLESSFAEKVLLYQTAAQASSNMEKQLSHILGCIRQSIASRSREEILLLYLSLLKLQLDNYVLFCLYPHKRYEQNREHPIIYLEMAK